MDAADVFQLVGTSKQVPYVDLAPYLVFEKKRKTKEHSKKHSFLCHSSKRSHQATSNVETSVVGQFFANDFPFHKGLNFSLSPFEKDMISSASIEDLAVACLEMQSHALDFTRFTCLGCQRIWC